MEAYVYLHTLLGLFMMLIVLGCIYYIRIRHQRKIFLQILAFRRMAAADNNQNLGRHVNSDRGEGSMLICEASVGQVDYPICAYPPTYEEVQTAKSLEEKPPPYEEVFSGNSTAASTVNENHQS